MHKTMDSRGGKMRTNRVEVQYDYEALDELHSFWQIKTSREHFKQGAAIFDSPAFDNLVQAVSFTEGNNAWLMFPASENGCDVLIRHCANNQTKR